MRARTSRTETVLAVLLCASGVALHFAPESVQHDLKAAVRDALRPGQLFVRRAETGIADWSRFDHGADDAERVREVHEQLRAWQQRCRQLQIANARLHEQLAAARQEQPRPLRSSPGDPLLLPELVQATVLGEESAALLRGGKLIDFARSPALNESTFVLEDTRPLIDQPVPEGEPVYSGAALVGRIAEAGRWVSTIQHVTDRDYRGFAQLARPAGDELVFGARGILAGTGEAFCRLEQISSTEPVAAGDHVYSADESFPEPMYYGRVVHADLGPGGLHWEIRVEPAVPLDGLRSVQVLRHQVNPKRLAAHETTP